jgi:hypothetical protein
MDEPDRFARVLLHFLDTTQPLPFDRAALKDRMINRSSAIAEPSDDTAQTTPQTDTTLLAAGNCAGLRGSTGSIRNSR